MHAPGLHGPDEGRAGLGRPVGRIACGWADGGHPFHGPTRQTFEPGSTSHGAALAYERVPGIREEIQGLFVDPRFTTGHGEIGLGAIRHQIEKQLVVTCQGPDQVVRHDRIRRADGTVPQCFYDEPTEPQRTVLRVLGYSPNTYFRAGGNR